MLSLDIIINTHSKLYMYLNIHISVDELFIFHLLVYKDMYFILFSYNIYLKS